MKGFLLTVTSRDRAGHFELVIHAAGETGKPLKIIIDSFRPLFFVPRSAQLPPLPATYERVSLDLKSMDKREVDCLYFSSYEASRKAALLLREKGVPVFESDIHPADRFLMERFVKGGFEASGEFREIRGVAEMRNPRIRGCDHYPTLSQLSLDIETGVSSGQIYSIACVGKSEVVFVARQGRDEESIRFCGDERSMLVAFLEHVATEDPDILVGWNVVGFDLRTLQQRCEHLGIPFSLGRGEIARVFQQEHTEHRFIARVPGRVVLDIPMVLRSYYKPFEEYSLDNVASKLLGKHKLIEKSGAEKIREIDRMFAHDPAALARYNLEDARLTREIFAVSDLLGVIIERSRLSGQLMDRLGASVASFDFLYLPLLHRRGHVAYDVADVPAATEPLTGGYVMDSVPGIHENVLVFDFRSLYPSIIMTFCIDPWGLVSHDAERVRGPVGPSFVRRDSILPSIIRELMHARLSAKEQGNTPLSQAIKILMNSFYGVLGTPSCRFFSADLAQTITSIGQHFLRQTSSHIQRTTGYRVIYGDTDSLFVLLGKSPAVDPVHAGHSIAKEVTHWLGMQIKEEFEAESALVLQFETHFRHFFMPSLRGTLQGSKKRYCGTILRGDQQLQLVFKGLESARSDWTELAKEFQSELYLKIFRGEPFHDFVIRTVESVRRGNVDSKLVYRKRLRKSLTEYAANVPPHVQAARLLPSASGTISYVITKDGPQPVGQVRAALDYDHYIETQLRPIADAVLEWVGTSFETVTSGQQDLFGSRGDE